MRISIIVAASENNAIGKDNKLLWHLPNDLRFFKNTTWGMPVVMGRKTYESVGRLLPGRHNIIITTNKNYKVEGATVVHDLEQAQHAAKELGCKELFIIGGGEIYRLSLAIAHQVHLTKVHTTIDGDTFFDQLDEAIWQLADSKACYKDEKHAFDYTFELYQRK